MKKTIKGFAIFYLVITIFSNTPPILYVLNYAIDNDHFRYSNASGSFTFVLQSGGVEGARLAFSRYRAEMHPMPQDTVMYRVFWRNPLAFWRYYTYFFDNRYNPPYRYWGDIKKIRDKTPKVNDPSQRHDWQDF